MASSRRFERAVHTKSIPKWTNRIIANWYWQSNKGYIAIKSSKKVPIPLKNPLHPYTIGLQKSKPTVDSSNDELYNIPGNVPNPVNMPNYCYFKERCAMCKEKCNGDYPEMIQVSPTHFVSCHLYEEGLK